MCHLPLHSNEVALFSNSMPSLPAPSSLAFPSDLKISTTMVDPQEAPLLGATVPFSVSNVQKILGEVKAKIATRASSSSFFSKNLAQAKAEAVVSQTSAKAHAQAKDGTAEAKVAVSSSEKGTPLQGGPSLQSPKAPRGLASRSKEDYTRKKGGQPLGGNPK